LSQILTSSERVTESPAEADESEFDETNVQVYASQSSVFILLET